MLVCFVTSHDGPWDVATCRMYYSTILRSILYFTWSLAILLNINVSKCELQLSVSSPHTMGLIGAEPSGLPLVMLTVSKRAPHDMIHTGTNTLLCSLQQCSLLVCFVISHDGTEWLLLVILKLSKRASRPASEPSTLDSRYSWLRSYVQTEVRCEDKTVLEPPQALAWGGRVEAGGEE